MSVRAIISQIKREKPATYEQFKKMFQLNFLGSGSYRQAYEIVNANLIVKFELGLSPRHTEREVEVCAILRKHPAVRRYLPTILYHAPGLIVMPKYTRVSGSNNDYDEKDAIEEKLREYVHVYDLHPANVMRDRRGRMRLTDMGMFLLKD